MDKLTEASIAMLRQIDEQCQAHFDDGHRKHLGASLIGGECSRRMWYTFRWVKHVTHSGQQYRLFNRGHLEEDRFVKYLEWSGFQVWELNPETGKQFQISDCDGHFGARLTASQRRLIGSRS